MLDRLRSIRLSWPQIALVAAASALSTAVIVATTTRAHAPSYASLAELRRRVAVHTVPTRAAAAPAPATATTPEPAAAAAAPATYPAPTGPSTAASTATTTGTDANGAGTTGTNTAPATTGTTPTPTAHPARHVFVIALTTTSYRATFGPDSVAHYLNRTLRRRAVLLSGYRTLGGSELPDYLAMVSGQAPNADTRGDCTTYADFASSAKPLGSGQVPGAGCVYPNTVLTITDQVTAGGKRWKAYVADMGASTCMHPDSNGAADGQLPGTGLEYAVWHNPFVYFHSLLDLGGCTSNDVSLQHLAGDLRAAKRTPTYAFIAPSLCDEPAAAACPGTQASGLAAEDAFLKRWVPAITASPAYRQNGVLIIVFAKAPAAPSGSVRTGALILSTRAKPGSTVATPYTPYSVLRSVEDLLFYTPLVHAKSAKSFASAAVPVASAAVPGD